MPNVSTREVNGHRISVCMYALKDIAAMKDIRIETIRDPSPLSGVELNHPLIVLTREVKSDVARPSKTSVI